MKKGIFLLVVGIAALIAIYSMRPPSNIAEAMMMASQGKENALKEPIYIGLMLISSVVSILGLVFVIKNINQSKS